MTEALPVAGLTSRSSSRWIVHGTLCARTLVVLPYTGGARTLPRVTAQSPAGPQPRTIQVTWIATLVAAVFSVLAPVTYFTARTWIEQQQRNSIGNRKITSSYTDADRAKDLANVADNVAKALPIQLIFGFIVAAILVVIALKLREGRHWTRWALIGVWVLVTLTGYSPVGLGGLVTLGSSAPSQVKLTSFLGAAAFAVALIAVNLPASIQYLNANRPPRPAGAPAGGVLGGLFRPRPMTPPAADPPKPAPARSTQPKPASTRPAQPAKPAQPTQRTKAKTRPASTESAGQAPPTAPTPKSGGAGRSRGKSRGR